MVQKLSRDPFSPPTDTPPTASVEPSDLWSREYLATLQRNKEVKYILEVVRSTDGESRFYNCGSESIQTAGSFVLQKVNYLFPVNYRFRRIDIPNTTGVTRVIRLDDQNSGRGSIETTTIG